MSSKKLLILVATMTGTTLMAAEDIAENCNKNGIETKILEMDNIEINVLTENKYPVLICSSTYGQGDVPDNAQKFYNNLKDKTPNLSHIKYALFGLGDKATHRETFAYGGKKFDKILLSLGAIRMGEPYFHDASTGSLPEEECLNWFKNNIQKLMWE